MNYTSIELAWRSAITWNRREGLIKLQSPLKKHWMVKSIFIISDLEGRLPTETPPEANPPLD